METAKNLIAVITGIVGIATALITLYAKFLDVKKSAAREAHPGEPISPATPEGPKVSESPVSPTSMRPASTADAPVPPRDPIRGYSPASDPDAIARARLAVKGPAITLMVLGFVSLLFNLTGAGYGFVDRYVTPLSDESRERRAVEAAGGGPELSASDSTAVITIMTFLSGSLAGAAAAWAGFGMIRLRSYWLSVAGSFAAMAAGPCCFVIGIPIGIWSLAVLYRPDVASSFS